MLRLVAVSPVLIASRSLADGRSGTLGQGAVGANEIAPGAVPLDRLAETPAGRVVGRAAASGSGALQVLDADGLQGIIDSIAPRIVYADRSRVESARPPASATEIETVSHLPGTKVGGARYVRVYAEPAHPGKLQSADGQWWELADEEPTPLMFGALWDGERDDHAAVQDWADFCRARRRAGRLPAGTAYISQTLYLGGIRIIGAGGANNADGYVSKTVLRCGGNPMISMGPAADTARAFQLTQWENFCLEPSGDPVAPIDLWDWEGYPMQIGIWLGRNHNHMQTLSEGEVSTSGGVGGLTMRRVTMDGVSGWGIYGYKLWGKSLMDDLFIRRTGGEGAAALGDRNAGAMRFDSGSVDYIVQNVHFFNRNYANPSFDGRGCGLRLGADKADTDALDRSWQGGNYSVFNRVHVEGYLVPLDLRSSKIAFFENMSLNGYRDGDIYIGWPSNPAGDCRAIFGRTRIADTATIHVHQAATVELGELVQAQLDQSTTIRYWTGCRLRILGADTDTTDLYRPQIRLEPQADLTTPSIGGRPEWSFLPLAVTDTEPASLWSNRLPAFAASAGGALADWSWNGQGQMRVDQPWRLELSGGAEVSALVSGLPAGEAVTIQLWFDFPDGASMDQVRFGARTSGGGILLERTLGSGAAEGRQLRAFNVLAPADGRAAVFARSQTGGPLAFSHPLLTHGFCRLEGRAGLSFWPTRSGLVQVG